MPAGLAGRAGLQERQAAQLDGLPRSEHAIREILVRAQDAAASLVAHLQPAEENVL
jgi:hypothetical protein